MKHHYPDENFIKMVIFVSSGLCMLIHYFFDSDPKK